MKRDQPPTEPLLTGSAPLDERGAEPRLRGQYAVAKVLAEARSLPEAAPRVLEALCTDVGWQVGTLWAVEPGGSTMVCVSTWAEPSAHMDEWEGANAAARFGPGDGLPGRAWAQAEPILLQGPEHLDPTRRDTAVRAGVGTVLEYPVAVGGTVRAVLELCARGSPAVEDELLQITGATAAQIELFLERMQAESDRRNAEELYRMIAENAHDMVSLVDGQGVVRFASPSHRVVLGLIPEDLVGRPAVEHVHPEDQPIALGALAEQVRATGSFLTTLRLRHADGHWVTVECAGTGIFDAAGELSLVLSTARDVTARLRTERRLRVQYAVTRALAEAGTLEEAGPEIIRAISESLGWGPGRLWTVDPDRESLHLLASWSPDGVENDHGRWAAGPRELMVWEGQGRLGAVWASGQPSWVEDVGAEPEPTAAGDADPAGFRGWAAFPILRGNEVVAILEFSSPDSEPPDPELLDLLSMAGTQVRQFMSRQEVEQVVLESEAVKSAMLEAAHDCIIAVDAHGSIVEFNPAAERTFGFRRAEVLGRRMADLIVPPSHRDRHIAAFERHLATGRSNILGNLVEMTAMRSDGTEFPVEITIKCVDLASGPMFTGYLRDISDRKRAEAEIAYLAYHDKLTGLPNRARFEEVVEMAIARAHRHDQALAVLYLDLDNFKLVNDSLGHAAGDELLRQVAVRLAELSRETDMVARLGGDEFLVLLADLRRQGTSTTAIEGALAATRVVVERIHECLSRPFVLEGSEFYISASIGVSIVPMDADDATTVLKNADAAMYRSKRAGPGGYVVFATEEFDAKHRLSLATRLRKAVDESDWVLHYQPQVDLLRGEVTGVEALLRWNDPEAGLLLPEEFVHVAEEMGLIEPIGDWVLDRLFLDWEGWLSQRLTLDIAFNISPRQLWRPEFVQRLLDKLDRAGVDPRSLVVELTESAAMAEADRTLTVVNALRATGIRFALDDFGTGHSSLGRLRDYPVDVLKIDRSFVRDLPNDADAGTMVRAIIQLAHSLGMTPVAEGIESEDQWRFLVDQGCLMGQGYLFHRPTRAEEVPAICGGAPSGSPGARPADPLGKAGRIPAVVTGDG